VKNKNSIMKHTPFILLMILALNLSAQKFNFSAGISLSNAGNPNELNQRLVDYGAPVPNMMIGGELEFSYVTGNNFSFSLRPFFMNSIIKNDSISTYGSKVIPSINFGKIFRINDDFKIKTTLGYAMIFYSVNSRYIEKTLISNQPKEKLPVTSFYQLSTYAHSLIFSVESMIYDDYSLSVSYALSIHNNEWKSNFYSFDQPFYDDLSTFVLSLKYYFN
jgi:hypothetical protein